jgi:hypothetical protein
LPAHAAAGQDVRLYAEKRGYGVADLYQRVSGDPVILQLKK